MSPVSIFALDELERFIGKDWVVFREMIGDEWYVDFNRSPLLLLGYMFVSVQVGKTITTKPRVLVAKKGREITGDNAVNGNSRENVDSEIKLSPDAEQLVGWLEYRLSYQICFVVVYSTVTFKQI